MELAAFALLIIGAWLWLDSTRVRELALSAARAACDGFMTRIVWSGGKYE